MCNFSWTFLVFWRHFHLNCFQRNTLRPSAEINTFIWPKHTHQPTCCHCGSHSLHLRSRPLQGPVRTRASDSGGGSPWKYRTHEMTCTKDRQQPVLIGFSNSGTFSTFCYGLLCHHGNQKHKSRVNNRRANFTNIWMTHIFISRVRHWWRETQQH